MLKYIFDSSSSEDEDIDPPTPPRELLTMESDVLLSVDTQSFLTCDKNASTPKTVPAVFSSTAAYW